jgi:hypothetical protein
MNVNVLALHEKPIKGLCTTIARYVFSISLCISYFVSICDLSIASFIDALRQRCPTQSPFATCYDMDIGSVYKRFLVVEKSSKFPSVFATAKGSFALKVANVATEIFLLAIAVLQ